MYPKVTNSVAGVDHLTIIKIFMYCLFSSTKGREGPPPKQSKL